MEVSAGVCAGMSGIAQLNYIEGTLHFFSAYVHSLSLVDLKLFVYHQISKLNILSSGPSPAVGLLVGLVVKADTPFVLLHVAPSLICIATSNHTCDAHYR